MFWATLYAFTVKSHRVIKRDSVT